MFVIVLVNTFRSAISKYQINNIHLKKCVLGGKIFKRSCRDSFVNKMNFRVFLSGLMQHHIYYS